MEKFVSAIRRFLRDEEGVTAIEYALMAALIALAIVGAVLLLGGKLANLFNLIGNCLAGRSTATCT